MKIGLHLTKSEEEDMRVKRHKSLEYMTKLEILA